MTRIDTEALPDWQQTIIPFKHPTTMAWTLPWNGYHLVMAGDFYQGLLKPFHVWRFTQHAMTACQTGTLATAARPVLAHNKHGSGNLTCLLDILTMHRLVPCIVFSSWICRKHSLLHQPSASNTLSSATRSSPGLGHWNWARAPLDKLLHKSWRACRPHFIQIFGASWCLYT